MNSDAIMMRHDILLFICLDSYRNLGAACALAGELVVRKICWQRLTHSLG